MEIVIEEPLTEKLSFEWSAIASVPSDISVRLTVPGAGLEIVGVFKGRNNANLPIAIGIHHEAPDTKSRVTLRGILKDQSSADIKITAFLQKGASGADAAIDAKALLLSEDAKAELRPYLEIDEQEVKATHATFVGPLDEEELFYVRSRGLSEEEARKILVDGFLAPVLSSAHA